jgi:hypothetical protein
MKRLLTKLRSKLRGHPVRRERCLRFESVEERRLMTASSIPKLANDAVISLAQVDAQDGSISRTDMLGIYAQVEADGKVSAAERKDLIAICNPSSGFTMTDDVRDLAHDVVGNNPANRHYLGKPLGNLKAGNSSAKLEKLVDKWFYGEDLPVTDKFSQYQEISGSLFVDGPSYSDAVQGASGDCYLMSSLAELAIKDPSAIENMFTDNGDGTFAVRFFQRGVARYVTVNEKLPVYIYGHGGAEYASFDTGTSSQPIELWVALAEKAYCQINEEGWTGHGSTNSYKAINAGSPVDVIAQITNDPTGFMSIKANSPSGMLNSIMSDFQNGEAITFATKNKGTAANVVHDHSYAMISYDTTTQEVTLYNPWGLNNGTTFPGLITLSWSEVVQSFSEWEVGNV